MSSGFPRRPRFRAWVVLVALVSSSCGGAGSRPVLGDSGSAEQVADAMQTLARVEGDVAVPTPHPPELFGFETVAPAEEVVPDTLWFDLAVPAGELGGYESEVVADAAEPDAVSDSEEVVDADEVSEDPEVELPDPPESAQVEGAPYPDPSAVIVAASGRHFPLFADDAPGATTRGVSPNVINVGGLVTQTLVGNPHRAAVCTGAGARFDQANHNGELTRRIEFVACHDDTGQSDLAHGLVGALVREEVFAIVPLASPAFLAEELLYEERVLYVGDEILPAFCGRSTSLGFGSHGARGCPVLDARGYVSIAEPVLTAYLALNAEMEAAAITYATTESPNGEIVAASRSFEAELLEHVEPTMLAVLPTAADGDPSRWSAVVSEILETAPEVIFLDGPRVKGLPAAIRSAGFDGELVLVGAVDPLTVIDTESRLSLAPLTVITPGLDLANRASPGWQAMEGAAAAVGIRADEIGLDFVEGYLAADFLVQALGATPDPLTIERVADALNKGWWYGGIDGVACGSWWPASHFIPTPCVSISRIEVFVDQLIPELALVDVEPQLKFNLSRD